MLSLSERQIYRIKKAVRYRGHVAVIHGNRGRSPSIRKSPVLRERIKLLYQNKYGSFNISHFTEKLVVEEGIEISRETVRQELMRWGLITKVKKPKHRQRRERMPKEGMLLQFVESDNTVNNMAVMKEIVKRKGIPWVSTWMEQVISLPSDMGEHM